MGKYYQLRNVYSRLKSYVSKFQLCIYDTSGDTAVFYEGILFFIFSFFHQIFRQYNSRTIRHRHFRFKTLNRSCYRLPQVNIWFQVLRTEAVKRQKTAIIYATISLELYVADFWFEILIGVNTVYLRYISDFKFCAQKWIRGQKTAKYIRHYASRTIRHSYVRLKNYIILIAGYPKYILV